MSVKSKNRSKTPEEKSGLKLYQYAQLAQLEAVRSGDRSLCQHVLQNAKQPTPFEIDFDAIKSLDDVRRLEHHILNLLLRDDFSVSKASFCLEQLKTIGEEIYNHEQQKEHLIKHTKEMAEERKLFPAKLKYFKSLDERNRILFAAQNRNFSILLEEYQNQELRQRAQELLSQDEDIDTNSLRKTSSQSGASKSRLPPCKKAQSRIPHSNTISDLAPSPKAAELNKLFPVEASPSASELERVQAVPQKPDETELRLPRITNESFKHIPSPLSPPRKTYL